MQAKLMGNFFSDHPLGLRTLFLTELWERFSYYGMRAILVLYMVAPIEAGGLGFSIKYAALVYGMYTMLVYMSAIPGGIIADYILGSRLSVLIGGIIIACGHFSLAFPQLPFFYLGLSLIIVGTGLLKPNISAMVGSLYSADDPRRDSGFSIFYMGINIGAFFAPLVCGSLAQAKEFKNFLWFLKMSPECSWHWGFAAAGIGMTFGLLQYMSKRSHLEKVGGKKIKTKVMASDQTLSGDDWKRIGAILILFFFTIIFWSIYEQAGTSLNLFADRLTTNNICGWNFPSSWYQCLNAIFVILLAPIFSMFWIKLGTKQPTSPAKFAYGLLFVGIGILLMVPASIFAQSGKVSPLWLISVYFIQVVGEMCFSPVGLSTVTKLAPTKILGLMLGTWFLAASLGNMLAGVFGSFFNDKDLNGLIVLFGSMSGMAFLAALLLTLLRPAVSRLMSGVH